MKKALLVVDHRERDLRGIVLIAYWLYVKHGIFPYLTTTKNEISSLIKYSPDLILLQHVRHKWQEEFLRYAKARGVKIALSIAEGFPNFPKNILFSAGRGRYLKDIDLIMPWGDIFIEECEEKNKYERIKFIATGSPRFDFHTKLFDKLNVGRDKFLLMMGLDDKPVILWMSSTKYANPKEGLEKLVERIKRPDASDHRIADVIEEKAKDHQRVYDIFSDYMLRIAEELGKDVNVIVKVHPAEPIEIYENKFKGLDNVVVINKLDKVSLTELIKYADIQVNWRCTTAAEAWMNDIENVVVGIDVDGLYLEEFAYLQEGSDIAKDYGEFRDKIFYYLEGGKTPTELLEKRKNFIRRFLVANDGKSAVRCADTVAELLKDGVSKKINAEVLKVWAKYIFQYRFNSNWTVLNRGPGHPKYISEEDVKVIASMCGELFGKKMEYKWL